MRKILTGMNNCVDFIVLMRCNSLSCVQICGFEHFFREFHKTGKFALRMNASPTSSDLQIVFVNLLPCHVEENLFIMSTFMLPKQTFSMWKFIFVSPTVRSERILSLFNDLCGKMFLIASRTDSYLLQAIWISTQWLMRQTKRAKWLKLQTQTLNCFILVLMLFATLIRETEAWGSFRKSLD